MAIEPPLCVDLDGTLLRTDLLYEALSVLVRQQPLLVFVLPFWLFTGGKARLKAEIAARVDISSAQFPLNQEVVDFTRAEKEKRETVLVTGSHQRFADSIAQNLDLFDRVQGSDEKVNLTNTRKREWLVEQYGEGGFDYIGNDKDDLKVWPSARKALAVSTHDGIAASPDARIDHVFEQTAPTLKEYLGLMRVHQWSKNVLILVPFFLDQRFTDAQALVTIVLAFFAMSFLASATYLVNDMLDLQADRQNVVKSKRAFASGRISLKHGVFLVVALLLAVLFLTFLLPNAFNWLLLVYLVSTVAYSLVLKQRAIIDVIVIAALHTLRVIGGIVAINAEWSFWLLAFSMFIFFSLALAKRVAELKNLESEGREVTIGRDYQVGDIPVLLASGVSTGFLSVLVVALYINGEKVQMLYRTPMLLWLVCPILMYWIARVWIKTSRGEMHEDPIVFAIKDTVSRLAVLSIMLAVVAAMFVAWQ